MSTTTTTRTVKPQTFTIEPTPVWTPLPLEGHIPSPCTTPNGLKVVSLHPSFGCELSGVDWAKPIPEAVYREIRDVVDKYGVVACRKTDLTDEAHIAFSSFFGDLDDVRPYIDAGNIDPNTGDVAPLSAAQVVGNKANELFHVDSSFNARRAGHPMLLAHIIPPAGMGGATEFADSKTAYDDLSVEKKKQLEGLVANHSLFHSRRKAVPEYFKESDPMKLPLSKHKLVQEHEWSGRKNLYNASYVHHIEGMDSSESTALVKELIAHVPNPKYRLTVPWVQNGDMIIWDNTVVLHGATGGLYEGKFKRDMRRTTVKDMSSSRFGLNGEGADWRVGLP
ncbi:hypothetical protein LTR17_000271 [Elasticomyces elasticus]|nr:hypothetical protein LTR17_000271 [Elasticomyces elasticus]